MEDSMTTRFEKEFDGVPWRLTRALAKHHYARATANAAKEAAWNYKLKEKRLAYLSKRRDERKAKMEAEFGTAEQRASRFYSIFERNAVDCPSLALSLSVGG